LRRFHRRTIRRLCSFFLAAALIGAQPFHPRRWRAVELRRIVAYLRRNCF
jgi:hypothetical protein